MKFAVILILLFFFILPVGFFLMTLRKGIKHTKADEWEGTVVDKQFNEKRDSDIKGKMNKYYSIVIKTNKSEERKIAVNSQDYTGWKIGDKVRKIKGKLGVEKI